MASATISPATVLSAIVSPRISTQRRTTVKHINGLNSFGGLKAHNNVATLGLPVCSEQSFAKIVSSLKKPSQGSRGGALTSTCNAIAEIFKIASILPGLVLVGVAVGFVLLRIEAIVEEE
ncbi:hypothetical protein ACJIZ3_015453 [Penstemon smallii]|uniref:Uncharacterized protein n=1 Tax=Penstemon smallii TaxID=265156 RepID=A0ABD3RUP0_9LAMI